MAYEHRENTATVFLNDKKTKDNLPMEMTICT